METTKKNKKKKRGYLTDPMKKYKQGKKWMLSLAVEKDVAEAILAEKNELPSGVEYNAIINDRLRAAYGIKK